MRGPRGSFPTWGTEVGAADLSVQPVHDLNNSFDWLKNSFAVDTMVVMVATSGC